MRILTIVAAVLLLAAPVHAQRWVRCGSYYYYQPQPVYQAVQVAPSPPSPPVTQQQATTIINNNAPQPAKTPQELLLEVKKLRDTYSYNVLKAQQDHEQFMQMASELGITQPNVYPSYQGVQLAAIGVTGTSPYGYSQQTIVNGQQIVDANLVGQLFLMSHQQVLGAQQLAAAGKSGFDQLLDHTITINSPRSGTTTVTNTIKSYGPITVPAPKLPNLPPLPGNIQKDATQVEPKTAALNILQTKCASCHNQQKASGGFKISDYFEMSPEDKGYVISLLRTNDINKRMPRVPDGTKLGRPGALYKEEIETLESIK